MKLINYKRGYNDTFECSIGGTITMSQEEWVRVKRYLIKKAKRLDVISGWTMWSKVFARDCKQTITTPEGNTLLSIGVTLTEGIAQRYHLTTYKQCNYQLHILGGII
jgi:hypothetical protein